MKKRFCVFVYYLLVLSFAGVSQTSEAPFSPGCGHNAKSVLKGAIVKNKYSSSTINSFPPSGYPSPAIMNCGRFDLYFEDILLGTSDGFDDPILGPVRRNTFCNVLYYLQNTLDFSAMGSLSNRVRINVLRSYATSNPSPPSIDWLAVGTPGYVNSGTPRLIYGFAYDYIKTGVDPVTPNDFHGTITVNFDKVNGLPIIWQDDYTSLFVNCSYDLYSILLHEMTHTIGWFSLTNLITGGSAVGSILGHDQYSGLDNLIHKGVMVPLSVTKMIQGTTTAPVINPGFVSPASIQSRDLWINWKTCPNNYPVYSGSPAGNGHVFDISKAISHMDEQSWAFSGRQRISPGYQDDYVMAPLLARGQIKREYSKGEIRTLVALGYGLNSGFTSTHPFVLTNNTPYSSNLVQAGGYEQDFFADTVRGDFQIWNTGTSSVLIDLSITTNLTLKDIWFDIDGDPITVYPNSLYNIRGCGNGGNNHNCLSISSNSQQITYTPRPGFYGRAQFAFNLYDGKEKGGLCVISINVCKGSNVPPAPGVNLVMNGNFEEGTEIKRLGAEEIIPNAMYEYDMTREGQFRHGTIFGDGQLYNYALINNNYGATTPNPYPYMSIYNSDIPCTGTIYTSRAFNGTFTGPLTTTYGERFYNLHDGAFHNFCLRDDLIGGRAYTLEYDYFYSGQPSGNIPFNINFSSLSQIAAVPYGSTVPSNYQLNTTFVPNTSWTHVSQTFTYCGRPSDILNFASNTVQSGLYVDNLSITQNTAQPFNSLTVTDNLGGQSCLGKSVQMIATGGNPICGASTSYSWLPTYLTGTSIVVSPTATTVYTIVAGTNVVTTHTIFVTVPNLAISASPSTTITCNSSANAVTLSATGATNYTWTTGGIIGNVATYSPIVNTVYMVTGKDGNNCVSTKTISIVYNNAPCACSSCNLTAINGVLGGGTLSSAVYCINSDITITGNVTLSASDFKVGSGVTITIASTGNLTINNSHFFGCTNMWQGFVVKNGGKLVITNSMIEDAIKAIDVTNNTQSSVSPNVIDIQNTTFNRNRIGIYIENYTQSISPYPFQIANCLFTCRNITTGSLSFPAASTIAAPFSNTEFPLSNPVINNTSYSETGASALLKFPYTTEKSNVGLQLKNVGLTINPTNATPSYYDLVIGSGTANTIFDNQIKCVDLLNSNFTTYNSIFQNTKGTSAQIGINAVADRYHHNRLQVLPVSGIINKFIDCNTAINAKDYFEYRINNSDFRSTQLSPANPSWQASGISISTSRYKIMDVSDNLFVNITHNLNLVLASGSFIIPGVSTSYGQYIGSVTFNRNTFRPHLTGNPVTYQKVGGAVIMQMYLAGSAQIFDNLSSHITQIDKNLVVDGLVGVNLVVWENHKVSVNSNTISIANNSYQSFYASNGININQSYGKSTSPIVVANNKVTGYGLSNPSAYGIHMSVNNYVDVNCNDISNVTNGLTFESSNFSNTIYNNTLSTNLYGLLLDQAAAIGIQGTSTNPQDNQWTGTWTTSYKTALLNLSDATGNKLFIRTSAPSIFNPNGSCYSLLPPATRYALTSGNLIMSSSSPPLATCPIIPSTARLMANSNLPDNTKLDLLEYIAVFRSPETVSPETDFIQKGHAYSLLKNNPDVVKNSPELNSFKVRAESSSYETFYQVENQLAHGNFEIAAALNEGISPTNKIETNYKNFYRLAVKHGLSQFTAEDSSSLRSIASLCPYTDGLIINEARVLMYVRYNVNVFGANCAGRGDITASNVKNVGSGDASEIQLFPNPALKTVNISGGGLKDGDVLILVTDVNGKILYERTLVMVNSLVQFELDLKNGIYFVKISQPETNNTTVKKLIIQK